MTCEIRLKQNNHWCILALKLFNGILNGGGRREMEIKYGNVQENLLYT
jgi:hypothetical protein